MARLYSLLLICFALLLGMGFALLSMVQPAPDMIYQVAETMARFYQAALPMLAIIALVKYITAR